MNRPIEPLDTALADFWDSARSHLGYGLLDVALGEPVVPRPQAWAFGDTTELADALVVLVLAGRKTAAAAPLAEYHDEAVDLPRVGGLSIVLDGAGQPRVLIRTTGVQVVPFSEIDPTHAMAEGLGDLSVSVWRTAHEQMWRELGPGMVSSGAPVVVEEFEVLYPPVRSDS